MARQFSHLSIPDCSFGGCGSLCIYLKLFANFTVTSLPVEFLAVNVAIDNSFASWTPLMGLRLNLRSLAIIAQRNVCNVCTCLHFFDSIGFFVQPLEIRLRGVVNPRVDMSNAGSWDNSCGEFLGAKSVHHIVLSFLTQVVHSFIQIALNNFLPNAGFFVLFFVTLLKLSCFVLLKTPQASVSEKWAKVCL